MGRGHCFAAAEVTSLKISSEQSFIWGCLASLCAKCYDPARVGCYFFNGLLERRPVSPDFKSEETVAGIYFFFLAGRRALERFGGDFFRLDFLVFLAIVLFFFCGLTYLRHVSFSEGSPIMRFIAKIVNGGREINLMRGLPINTVLDGRLFSRPVLRIQVYLFKNSIELHL